MVVLVHNMDSDSFFSRNISFLVCFVVIFFHQMLLFADFFYSSLFCADPFSLCCLNIFGIIIYIFWSSQFLLFFLQMIWFSFYFITYFIGMGLWRYIWCDWSHSGVFGVWVLFRSFLFFQLDSIRIFFALSERKGG